MIDPKNRPKPPNRRPGASRASTNSATYPRAWDHEDKPAQTLIGVYDIADIMGWNSQNLVNNLRAINLPFADGPDVNGYPTWTRGAFLAWAYLRATLPGAFVGEAQTFLATREGKRVLERTVQYLPRAQGGGRREVL